MNTDINSNEYAVYEGEFTYEYVNHTIGGDVTEVSFTVNGEELILTTEKSSIVSGTYTGRIIYAQNSKYLLDYAIYENPNK